MIRRVVLRQPDAIVDVTIDLWKRLASQLVPIIGEGGFESLFLRSVHLSARTFPWMRQNEVAPSTSLRFTNLQTSLAAQECTLAGEASTTLLITFVDNLALLIGELLTSSILFSAWNEETSPVAGRHPEFASPTVPTDTF